MTNTVHIEKTDSGYVLIPNSDEDIELIRDIKHRGINWVQVVNGGKPDEALNLHLNEHR